MCWNKKEGKLSVGGFLLRLILVIIFVLLLIWLCPMLGSTTYNNSLFNDNINRMKDAATSYYTNERLPKEIGESTRITLKDMVNNKLLLPIVDGRGRTCNEEASYVKIDKKATEYLMTIYLSCEKEADFVEVHMGCYDKCDTFDLSKQNLEFQFKKTTSKTKKIAYCPETYFLKDNKCQRIEKEVDYKDVIKTLSCGAGYTLQDNKCIGIKESTTSKICPSGYIMNEAKTNCVKTNTSTTNLICPSGYTMNASKTNCVKTNTSTTSLLTRYTCPSGYARSGTKCTLDTTIFKGYTNLVSTYTAETCDTCATVIHYLYESTASTTKYCPSGYTKNAAGTSCYKNTEETTNTTCPSGYTKNAAGTSCYKNTEETTSLICPTDYTDKNGVCTATSTITKDATTILSCPTNYTKNGNKCLKETATIRTTKVLYKSKIVTSTQYKWSKESSITGWILTGKTRSVKDCEC